MYSGFDIIYLPIIYSSKNILKKTKGIARPSWSIPLREEDVGGSYIFLPVKISPDICWRSLAPSSYLSRYPLISAGVRWLVVVVS